MKTTKKFITFITVIAAMLLSGVLSYFLTADKNVTAMAQTEVCEFENEQTDDEQVEPRGWFTNMKLGIKGENGVITATVKNEFTMFNSVIWVFVELYSSEDYQEAYSTMTLMARDNIRDLDMGKTISVSVNTNGETRYWQARMRYKFDNNDWVAKTTSTFLYDGNGNEIIY